MVEVGKVGRKRETILREIKWLADSLVLVNPGYYPFILLCFPERQHNICPQWKISHYLLSLWQLYKMFSFPSLSVSVTMVTNTNREGKSPRHIAIVLLGRFSLFLVPEMQQEVRGNLPKVRCILKPLSHEHSCWLVVCYGSQLWSAAAGLWLAEDHVPLSCQNEQNWTQLWRSPMYFYGCIGRQDCLLNVTWLIFLNLIFAALRKHSILAMTMWMELSSNHFRFMTGSWGALKRPTTSWFYRTDMSMWKGPKTLDFHLPH